MSKNFFILLEEFSGKPKIEIGQLAKSISKFTEQGIPTPVAVCVPIKTLELIAQKNSLAGKIRKILLITDFDSTTSKTNALTKIKRNIIGQSIPENISSEFLDLYHSYLKSGFVSIQDSIHTIKGDVNVIDSLLETWAQTVEHELYSQIINKKLQASSKNVANIIFSTPFLIKQKINSQVSGSALTFDDRDGNKKIFTIKSVWGIDSHDFKNETSKHYVDVKSLNVVGKTTNKQTYQYIREVSLLRKQKLGANKLNKLPLNSQQAQKLADLISKIKKLSIAHLEISWSLENNNFLIDQIKETFIYDQTTKKIKQPVKKVYSSVQNSQENKIAEKFADGLAIMNSGDLLSLLGIHPIKISKTSQKRPLIEAISKTIGKYSSWQNLDSGIEIKPHIIYRSQNLTANELEKLEFSSNFEAKEKNPYLGLRGATKILGQPQIFDMELEIIKNILAKNQNKISLLVPFCRSADETRQILKIIDKSGLNKNANFNTWLEISTPENALNISNYPLEQLHGFVMNIKSIYDLIIGIDSSNKDVLSRYPDGSTIIINLIRVISKEISAFSNKNIYIKKQKLFIDLTNFDIGILNEVLKEKIDGVIVNHKVTELTKKCIINSEEKVTLE